MVKKFFLLSMTLLLFACHEETSSYDYFMQHPDAVEKVLADCEANTSEDCETARRAEQDFLALTNDRDQDPQKFGEKIILAENDLVAKKISLNQLQATLKKNPDNNSLAEQVNNAKAAFLAQDAIVKTLLAVVAAGGSPQ